MNNYDEKDDPIFTVDAMLGRILDALFGVGLFCAFVAACFFAGYIL